MKCLIKVQMDNAAFEGQHAGQELARILRQLAEGIDGKSFPRLTLALYDVNGNSVGLFRIVEET